MCGGIIELTCNVIQYSCWVELNSETIHTNDGINRTLNDPVSIINLICTISV